MDVKYFNESISKLIQKSDNKFGFVQPEQAKLLHSSMDEVTNQLKKYIDECLLICKEQHLVGTDNMEFGILLSEMTKIMWISVLRTAPKISIEEASKKAEEIISKMSSDSIKSALITEDMLSSEEKHEDLIVKYDSLSTAIIIDAYKTLLIKKLRGE